MFGQTLFACRVYQNYGDAISKQVYEPAGFKLSLGLKDIKLALQRAQTKQMPMPLASLLHDRLLTLADRGHGDLDWAALALKASEEAGLSAN